MADRNFGLLVNPGNYSGSSAELTDDEKKQLRAISALQMGASMLANNQGNYGAFAPVLGVGLQNGLASYQFNKDRMQKDAEQRRLAEASRTAYQNAYIPASPAGFNVQGMGNYTNPQDAAVSAGLAPATLGSFSDMGIMPNTIAATEGKPFPSSRFNLQGYQLPEQPVTATPATQGGLDFTKYGQNLIESGYPKLYDKGIDIALASQPKNVDPKLVTRWNPEKQIEEQGWVYPGSVEFTSVGQAKPDDKGNLPDKVRQYEYAKSNGYDGSYIEFLKIVPELQAGIMRPYREAEVSARERGIALDEREADYKLPPQRKPQPRQQSGFSVTAPDGKTYSFPSQQRADAFKRKVGGK